MKHILLFHPTQLELIDMLRLSDVIKLIESIVHCLIYFVPRA